MKKTQEERRKEQRQTLDATFDFLRSLQKEELVGLVFGISKGNPDGIREVVDYIREQTKGEKPITAKPIKKA